MASLGELESKTHNFYMHFLFKQTYIQIMNIFYYPNLFVYYTEKKKKTLAVWTAFQQMLETVFQSNLK